MLAPALEARRHIVGCCARAGIRRAATPLRHRRSAAHPRQRFEARRPSQPVRLQRVTYERRLKTARYREVSKIRAGLRVRNLAMEAPFLPPVSAGLLVSRF